MQSPLNHPSTRREFIKTSGKLAAASALAGLAVPHVHAAEDNTIRIALIGCGGRGAGAAADALSTKFGPVKLVAMADILDNRLSPSYQELNKRFAQQVDVPADRRFVDFDGYQKAMDSLRPGDIAILATPPAFRWVHFKYAIQKGLNVFMEKPVTVDGPTSKRMFELGKEAEAKNLKVGVGLMSRHSRAMQELHKRVEDGELGDIILMRAYRMQGIVAHFASVAPPPGENELIYQIRRFHSFLWSGGGAFNDYNIHLIDHLCWMKNAWPIKAQAIGGRHYRHNAEGQRYIDQNLDTYGVEYTFADGAKFYFDGRCMSGCETIYSSYLHGSKGMGVASRSSDCGLPSMTFKGQNMRRPDLIWESVVPPDEQNPYVNEWNDLMEAIRNDKPYNEVEYGVNASLVSSLGRMAAHTGQETSYNDMLNCPHEFAPDVDKLTYDSPAPVRLNEQGLYPVPEPGIKRDREY